jgi:hypothetical protein
LTGQNILPSTRVVVVYILISEPLWFVLVLIFALNAGRSILKEGMMEG